MYRLLTILIFLSLTELNGQQVKTVDRVDTAYVNKLNRTALDFRFVNLDSLLHYSDRAFEAAESINYIPGKVEATRITMMAKVVTSEYKEVIPLLFALKLEVNDSTFLRENAVINNGLGTVYSISGNYRAGLPYLIEAAEGFRKIGERDQLLINLNNIGVCYIRLEMFREALEVYKEIESDFDQNKGSRTVLSVNFGYSYYGLGQYDKAKQVLTELLSRPKEEVDERGYGFAYFKLGEVLLVEDSVGKAEDAFLESIRVFELLEDRISIIEPILGYSRICLLKGNYPKAYEYAERALNIANEQGVLQYQSQALERLTEIYKAEGNAVKALEVFEQLKEVGDSLNVTQNSQEVGQLTAEYRFNQQRNDLLLAQKEQEITNLTIISAISVLLIIAIVLVVTFYRQRRRKEIWANRMEELNSKLERTVEKRTSELQSALDDMETFAHSASHDLKSPIQSIAILTQLIGQDEADRISGESKQKLDMVGNRIRLMLDLIEGIKNYSQVNHKSPFIEDVNVSSIIEHESNLLYADEKVKFMDKCPELVVRGSHTLVTIIFRNLLSNAVNHNDKEEKLVEVSYEGQEGGGYFKVEDNGPGIPTKRRERAFRLFETLGSNSSGLGLSIVKRILEKMGGEIWITDSELGGACINFTWKSS